MHKISIINLKSWIWSSCRRRACWINTLFGLWILNPAKLANTFCKCILICTCINTNGKFGTVHAFTRAILQEKYDILLNQNFLQFQYILYCMNKIIHIIFYLVQFFLLQVLQFWMYSKSLSMKFVSLEQLTQLSGTPSLLTSFAHSVVALVKIHLIKTFFLLFIQ